MSRGLADTHYAFSDPTKWSDTSNGPAEIHTSVHACAASTAAATGSFSRSSFVTMEYDSEDDAWVESTSGSVAPSALASSALAPSAQTVRGGTNTNPVKQKNKKKKQEQEKKDQQQKEICSTVNPNSHKTHETKQTKERGEKETSTS